MSELILDYESLNLRPITLKEAKEYVRDVHRHHDSPAGWKFGIGLEDESGELRGVVVVSRPVARNLDDGFTCEVTRLCTDGVKNGASMLYGAARRAAKAMGYRTIYTYTLEEEPGTSLKASGWEFKGISPGGSWSSKNRPREDKHPLGPKKIWYSTLN